MALFGNKSKRKLNRFGDETGEKLKETPKHLGEDPTLLKKMAVDAASIINPPDFLSQLLGINTSHENTSQPQETPASEKTEYPVNNHEGTIFSFHHLDRREGEHEIAKETRELLKEIGKQVKLLQKSEKKLEGELAKVSVDKAPTKAGIYYIRFFEWLLTVIRQLRMKVEESSSWLSEFNGRGKKKKGYWGMFKKHGTTFGMSNERSLATSAG